MRFFAAVTDASWFHFLAGLRPDEVNLWRPGVETFRAVPKGAPILFVVSAPNAVVGGGVFVRHVGLSISLAWDLFGTSNGAPDLNGLLDVAWRQGCREDDPAIGCTVVASPVFLPRDQWIPVPDDWSPSIHVGKTYSTEEPEGRRLWAHPSLRPNPEWKGCR